MDYSNVRINRLIIDNIKCVRHGEIDFNAESALRRESASIMGIYGQNGSGKTVALEAVAILKAIFSGSQIPSRYLDLVSFGEKSCSIEVELSVVNTNADYSVVYKCVLEQRCDPNVSAASHISESKNASGYIISVVFESLKACGIIDGQKFPKQIIAETDEKQRLIKPKSKCYLLYGRNEDSLKKLDNYKILAQYGARSFIFSEQARMIMDSNCKHAFHSVINAIANYAKTSLFIVGGEIQSQKLFPINFVIKNNYYGAYGYIPFSLESTTIIQKIGYDVFKSFLQPLNLVLSKIIPGLQIKYISKKSSLDEKDDSYEIELFSSYGSDNMIPLRHESLGIKKIISFLSLLIAAYNDSGFTIAVDEFDSSVFEFLLGELVGIMKDSGKGQFIFTSHNLRPLEKLDDDSIRVTTTNPENRYFKLKKKATNNMRDIYYRAISLGDNEYDLYNSESKYELAFAFRQAEVEK